MRLASRLRQPAPMSSIRPADVVTPSSMTFSIPRGFIAHSSLCDNWQIHGLFLDARIRGIQPLKTDGLRGTNMEEEGGG